METIKMTFAESGTAFDREVMEDEELIRQYLCRDEQAVQGTDQKYGSQIRALARHLLGSAEDADECRNDTLFKAWNSIPPHIPHNLKAYLMRVCRSLACDRLDWKNAKKRSAELIAITEELENCLPDPRTEDGSREIREAIESFLRKEERESRIIFIRRYWYAQKVDEIAQALGKKSASVRVILHRMRKRLKVHLEKEGIGL